LSTTAALWVTVVALGIYHGLNPAMGWPLAVANGLAGKEDRAVFATLLPLGGGHLAAMSVALLPFAWLAGYVSWSRTIQLGAGALVLLFGIYRLMHPRHPRALARIRPTQLAWWSFWMATAHGAGLMLLPFMLGLCGPASTEDSAAAAHATVARALASSNLVTALSVAAVHTLAMLLSGLLIAWSVYRYLGLEFLRRAWLNLDVAWAGSLVLAGAAGLAWAV
jgi:hypothetical protein